MNNSYLIISVAIQLAELKARSFESSQAESIQKILDFITNNAK